MTQTVYGTKYEATKGLSTTELAKLVRADVKAAVAAGTLPKGLKTSVRTRYFAGGSSLDVEVTALPESFRCWNPEYLLAEADGRNTYGTHYRSDELTALVKTLDALVDAYNFDGSDSQTDYFHVRFYGAVTVSSDVTEPRRTTEYQALHAAQVRESFVRLAVKNFSAALHGLVKACEAHANFVPDLSGLTRKTGAPQPSFKDLSANYGCPATLTTAVFQAHGITHVARRFWRADAPGTGKIELYTVEPGTETEDFFREVNEFEPNKVDLKAITAIIGQDKSYVPSDAFGSWERFAAIEIY